MEYPYENPFTCNDRGEIRLDPSSWQCIMRDIVDNRIFPIAYIILLLLLIHRYPIHISLLFSIIICFLVFKAYACSLSGNLFIRGTESMVIMTIIGFALYGIFLFFIYLYGLLSKDL